MTSNLTNQSPDIHAHVVELYNMLMAEIEPELVTANIGIIDELYAKESTAERVARGERYASALELFSKRLAEYLAIQGRESVHEKSKQLSSYESKAQEDEQSVLRNLTKQIQTNVP